jgi:choline-sulfatase
MKRAVLAGLFAALAIGCQRPDDAPRAAAAGRPSILLVTLDTTRADSIGPESAAVETPAFSGLAAGGLRFAQAYATAPQTLPSHASMLTGLYPAGHGVHENGRRLAADRETLTARLSAAGYDTAAFISGFTLDRQFGLERGFALYDDDLGQGLAERSAEATTTRALSWLERRGADARPFFLWVHYYDPHEPYAPPEPFRSRYPSDPYLGEIAAMDAGLGQLLAGYEAKVPVPLRRIVVLGDHGESRGEHGETFHGNLLYQGAVRVPLVLAGEGIAPGVREEAVSTRRVFDTVSEWAGLAGANSLRRVLPEPAVAEAMQPYLLYGWQPQVMVVSAGHKAIRAGGLEVYDLAADPREERDLGSSAALDAAARQALRDYPLPNSGATATESLDAEARRKLASLGYIAAPGAPPTLRADAPAPREMTRLFAALDRGSGFFVQERWSEAIGVFEDVWRQDPRNFTVALRLAVANAALGRDAEARRWFERAATLDPESIDLAHYRAMNDLRHGRFADAEAGFQRVLEREPERLPALTGLAEIRERQGRFAEAIGLLQRAAPLERDPAPALSRVGAMAMATGDTPTALAAYERLREVQGETFDHDLELGVLYLDARRLDEAAAALDRVPTGDPRAPMALFKRAQVSVLRGEPDREERVRAAYRAADSQTRPLIERESLFRDISLR